MPDKSTSGILTVTTQGVILSANRSACSIFGYSSEELVGKQARLILPDANDTDEPCGLVKGLYADTSRDAGEFFGLRGNNSEFPVEVSVSLLNTAGLESYVCVVRDISRQNLGRRVDRFVNTLFKRVLQGEGLPQFAPHICEFVSNIFGFPLVWIGSREDDGRISVLAAHGSHKPGLLKKSANLRWDEMGESEFPAARAIRKRQACFVDLKNESAADIAGLAGEAARGRQIIAFPLHIQNEDVYGVLQVHSNVSRFDEAIVRHLETLSLRLGVAIQIAHSQKRLHLQSAAIASTSSAIFITDEDGIIQWVNDAFTKLSGYRPDEVVGKTPRILKSGVQDEDHYKKMWKTITSGHTWHGELVERHKSGALYTVEQTVTPIQRKEGHSPHFVVVHDDLTAHKYAEGRIHHLANYDQLTGLYNRSSFLNLLETAIDSAKLQREMVAVLFIDLTNFNRINDTLGHASGDRLLKIVADRIKNTVPENSVLARVDGDEFAMATSGIERADEAAALARKIIEVILDPIDLGTDEINIGACVGISVYPDDGDKADKLVNYADMALHKAVRSAPNSYFFFSKEMNSETESRLLLEQDLRRAIGQEEFVLHYQPQIDIKTKKILGWEALVRWKHPEKGMIPPGRFIPIAEDTGLIVPLGDWVLKEALQQTRKWRDNGLNSGTIAVNLSAIQFQQEDLATNVEMLLAETGVEPSSLELELTETVVMQDAKLADNILSQLSSIGVQLAIDDFGTGYSSLNYLKRFPVDRLKIDQSFVRDMTSDYDDAEIARAIINLGHSLGLEVVSEGVESIDQLNLLREQSCDVAQGYFIARPMPADQVPPFMEDYINNAPF